MKHLTTPIVLAFLGLLGLLSPQQVNACDRATYTLSSVLFTGTNYRIITTVCIGAGRNGSDKGQEQNTGELALAFWDATPGFVIDSIRPMTLCPDTIKDTITCLNQQAPVCPPVPNPLGMTCRVRFTRATTGWYTCIDSQVLCGDTHTVCRDITIYVNQLPDSIRMLGVEGANIGTNGCFPDPDMAITTFPLPIVWGSFVATASEEGVQLNWVSYDENPGDYFVVQRSGDGLLFEDIADVNVLANGSKDWRSYGHFDGNPLVGINYYRLRQVASDGSDMNSEVIQVTYAAPTALAFNFVSPVPTADIVTVSFRSPENGTAYFRLMDRYGRLVAEQNLEVKIGSTDLPVDLTSHASGIYFVSLTMNNQTLTRKVVKM